MTITVSSEHGKWKRLPSSLDEKDHRLAVFTQQSTSDRTTVAHI